ncbi:MAG: GNAT family N-acetyltransferase [Anaerolineae bacterium]|nr:GNAT family N-acetyltransferase [Anaerolineae bacterium]
MNTQITHATRHDAADIAPFMADVFMHTYGHAIPHPTLKTYLTEAFNVDLIEAQLHHPQCAFLLARVNGHLAGICQMRNLIAPPVEHHFNPHKAVEIERFYVAQQYHSQGIASQLLAAATALAENQAMHTLWLCVWEHNRRALGFYAKHGFNVIGDTAVWVHQVHFHDFVMVKSLSVYSSP